MWLMATSGGALLAMPLPLFVEVMSMDRRANSTIQKVSLRIWLMMIWFWTIEFPVTKAAAQAKIAESSAVAFYQWFRDICSWKLLQQQMVLGGPNTIVHIDESLFRHTPKVR